MNYQGMKKLMYLFVAANFFLLTACSRGGSSVNKKTKQLVCTNKGEGGLADHSCCIIKDESDSLEVIILEKAAKSDLMNEEKAIKIASPDN